MIPDPVFSRNDANYDLPASHAQQLTHQSQQPRAFLWPTQSNIFGISIVTFGQYLGTDTTSQRSIKKKNDATANLLDILKKRLHLAAYIRTCTGNSNSAYLNRIKVSKWIKYIKRDSVVVKLKSMGWKPVSYHAKSAHKSEVQAIRCMSFQTIIFCPFYFSVSLSMLAEATTRTSSLQWQTKYLRLPNVSPWFSRSGALSSSTKQTFFQEKYIRAAHMFARFMRTTWNGLGCSRCLLTQCVIGLWYNAIVLLESYIY